MYNNKPTTKQVEEINNLCELLEYLTNTNFSKNLYANTEINIKVTNNKSFILALRKFCRAKFVSIKNIIPVYDYYFLLQTRLKAKSNSLTESSLINSSFLTFIKKYYQTEIKLFCAETIYNLFDCTDNKTPPHRVNELLSYLSEEFYNKIKIKLD
jgi:hypothetical protein